MLFNDLRHMRVPAKDRGALWWLRERVLAERAVTLADCIIEHAHDDCARYRGKLLLDVRLDHLERVDDACDAIMCELSRIDPPMAEVVERYCIKQERLSAIAHEHGVKASALREQMYGALDRVHPPACAGGEQAQ